METPKEDTKKGDMKKETSKGDTKRRQYKDMKRRH